MKSSFDKPQKLSLTQMNVHVCMQLTANKKIKCRTLLQLQKINKQWWAIINNDDICLQQD